MACLHRRRRCEVLSSVRLRCARCDGEHPLFKQARRRAVGLQMCRIDHDALWFRSFACKPGEDAVEHYPSGSGG